MNADVAERVAMDDEPECDGIERVDQGDVRYKLGSDRWQQTVVEVVAMLKKACAVDYVMLGGGNAKRFTEVPAGARLGHNANAFLGGYRLWNLSLPAVRTPGVPRPRKRARRPEWRVV